MMKVWMRVSASVTDRRRAEVRNFSLLEGGQFWLPSASHEERVESKRTQRSMDTKMLEPSKLFEKVWVDLVSGEGPVMLISALLQQSWR